MKEGNILSEVRTDVKWLVSSMKEIKQNYVTQAELNLRLKPVESAFSLTKKTVIVALVSSILGLIWRVSVQ